jgi:hypothetical protein
MIKLFHYVFFFPIMELTKYNVFLKVYSTRGPTINPLSKPHSLFFGNLKLTTEDICICYCNCLQITVIRHLEKTVADTSIFSIL